MFRRIAAFCTSTVLVVWAGGLALAADAEITPESFAPAVSGFNSKIAGGYFLYDGPTASAQHNGFVEGSLTGPLGDRFGYQIDAGIAGGDLNAFGGVGAHLFWRDPAMGLLGIYGDYVSPPVGNEYWRIGLEGEAYLDRFSVEGSAGYQDLTHSGGSFFSGDITLAYYPIDNLRLKATVLTNTSEVFGRVGAEYLFSHVSAAPALFADGTFGNGITTVRAGLRLYFGTAGKSLIKRHREDDPVNIRIWDPTKKTTTPSVPTPTPTTTTTTVMTPPPTPPPPPSMENGYPNGYPNGYENGYQNGYNDDP